MIIGHTKQRKFFENIKEKKTIPHAFIFSGEEKIGKKLIAKEISMSLNCLALSDKPCYNCKSCIEIEKGIYKDVCLIEDKTEIKISDIKNLINNLSYKTDSSNFKIGIIDNAHLMTKDAQNCFLKTLEEPTERTLFFLITKYPDLLLKTIISRSWKIKFFPLNKEEIKNYLIKSGASNTRLERISNISFGCPGIAIDLLKDENKEKNRDLTILEIDKIIKSSIFERLQYSKKVTEEESIGDFFDLLIYSLRNKIFNSFNMKEDIKKIKNNLKVILDIKYKIESTNANSKLLIENLLINIK